MQQPHGPLRSFGRLKSRPIKPRQAELMETLLPRIALDPLAGPIAVAGRTWAEIGFGGGEHFAAQAAANPDVTHLGAEPFLNGMASCLRHVDERALPNVRLYLGDARELLAALPNGTLERLFILFPDPWPKARQQKRRLVQPPLVADCVRVLQPGGRLRFATDVKSYADQALERFLAHGALQWPAQRADDWRTPPADHVRTRYEEKNLGDCAPVFFDFVRQA
jgi:tRNA (guanine-N7-)-methyltransferase